MAGPTWLLARNLGGLGRRMSIAMCRTGCGGGLGRRMLIAMFRTGGLAVRGSPMAEVCVYFLDEGYETDRSNKLQLYQYFLSSFFKTDYAP